MNKKCLILSFVAATFIIANLFAAVGSGERPVDGALQDADYSISYSWTGDAALGSAEACDAAQNLIREGSDPVEVIIGSGTGTQEFPLHRHYNYSSHEAIYLASEIGMNGNISSLAYDKASGSNASPIEATSIYMKHTTASIFDNGDYSLDGYTLVYSGAFPNTGRSGWMEVDFSEPFAYNGVDNLSILVIKGNQIPITDNPVWRYSTFTEYRARQKVNNYSQPIELSRSSCLPNLRLKIYPVAVYNPPKNLSAIPGNQSVILNWEVPNLSVPDSYKIFRDGVFLISVTGFSYQDDAVSNDTQYSYYVVAVYPETDSEPSNTVIATPNVIVFLGSGIQTTAANEASPVNTSYKSSHGQSVYTKSELNTAGIIGPIYITQIGFKVALAPTSNLPNFIVRMKHTSATNVSSWQNATGLQTVYSNPSYAPQTGWDMIILSSPFLWNGHNNIVVDTAFGLLGNTGEGKVYCHSIDNGYRYTRNNTNNQTNVFLYNVNNNTGINRHRPHLKLVFRPLLIPVPFVEGFESGAADWILVNGNQVNKWQVGEADHYTGTKSIYISDDGGTNNSYDVNQASISHFFSNISFPSSEEDFYLRFTWKANGEGVEANISDYLQVYLTETTITPLAGTELSATGLVDGALLSSGAWQNISIPLPADLAGSSKRLIFSWKNNGSGVVQAPAAIDNIRIVQAQQQEIAIVIGGESGIELPPVTIGGETINSSITFTDLTGSTVSCQAGYASVESPLGNAGLDLVLSADSFAGATLTINHNLGFIPPTIAYSLGAGAWNIISASDTWTAFQANFTISASKQDSGELIIVFSKSEEGTLPVTLASFTAVLHGHSYVSVDWATASETGVMGYYVLRSDSADLAEAEAISGLITAANSAEGAIYNFRDKKLCSNSTYYYWLNNLDFSGAEGYNGPLAVHIDDLGGDAQGLVPAITAVLGNYPNPFNCATHLHYALAKAAEVKVQIYNSRGQLLRTISGQHDLPGYYKLIFDGKDSSGRELSSGVYIYRTQIGKDSFANRMLLLK
ncbi:MAG: T9SS type A sorting domain-containing protein [Candidatus Cloacimonetes bacterium]|nr:T9SS type A sorting domain-containing protein [Candidatus Cloacimonadota bacterium]